MDRPCPCGSGQERFELKDAAGIFCAFVCDACEAEKRKKFNPAIFDDATLYAGSGDEQDIGLRYGEDY